jgi:hypothetical protein
MHARASTACAFGFIAQNAISSVFCSESHFCECSVGAVLNSYNCFKHSRKTKGEPVRRGDTYRLYENEKEYVTPQKGIVGS